LTGPLPYNPPMVGWSLAWCVGLASLTLLSACVNEFPAVPQEEITQAGLTVGRVRAVLTGERGRRYEPTVRFFEVENRQTKERFTVDIQSANERFIVPLAPGEYELTRVQINEGPFLSIAELGSTFSIGPDPVTYLGAWDFGVDSPRYGRMVSVSMVNDEEDRAEALETLSLNNPSLDGRGVATVLPNPPQVRTRLFEVMPYPRVPRYFRRHWW